MTPPFGLRNEVADLVILAWAALRTRAWYDRGGAVPPPRPGGARAEMELRPEPLPAPADWKKATTRAEALFGLHVNPYLTAAGVAELAADIQQRVGLLADDASGLSPRSSSRTGSSAWTLRTRDGSPPPGQAADLLDGLRRAGGDRVRLIETLGGAQLPCTEAALANSLSRARVVADACAGSAGTGSHRSARRKRHGRTGPVRRWALDALREGFARTSLPAAWTAALSAAEDALFEWLSAGREPEPRLGQAEARAVRGLESVDKPALTSSPWAETRSAGRAGLFCARPVGEFLRSHPDENVVVEWRVTE